MWGTPHTFLGLDLLTLYRLPFLKKIILMIWLARGKAEIPTYIHTGDSDNYGQSPMRNHCWKKWEPYSLGA